MYFYVLNLKIIIMKNIYLILLASILFLFASCSITQEFHFNKDFSGTSKISIDMSQAKTFMSGMDSTGKDNSLDTLDKSFAETAELLKKAGAENIKYGWNDDKTILSISYDFKDIETLNRTSREGGDAGEIITGKAGSEKKAEFFGKGKKFTYKAPEKTEKDTLFNSDEMAGMKDYFKYTLKFSFDRQVKKYDNKNAVLSADKKEIIFSGNMSDMLKEGYTTDLNVKLKSK